MKILYVTTVGLTMIFFRDLVCELVEDGNIVDIATNEKEHEVDSFYDKLGCCVKQIDFSRFPLNKDNIRAYKQLKNFISENHYDIVHCHTPVAGAITRLACRKLGKEGLRIIYTAHGFHFYKGAPLKNWLIYYPIEKICSNWTDVLITINKEDCELAKKKMKAKRIEYVPGVGIDVDKFANTVVNRAEKRKELGIPEDAFLLLSVGELNKNKNHQIVIRALAELNNQNIHYMIAGQGSLHDYLFGLAQKLNVEDQVHLLGYRTDVAELYKTADVNVFPTIREGLGLGALEGMASGLPLICSDNRGTREYAVHNMNAIVCQFDSVKDFYDAISELFDSREEVFRLGNNGQKKAEYFKIKKIIAKIQSIYAGRRDYNE